MSSLELALAVLGGVVVAALLCWAAVIVALHASRRAHDHAPTGGHPRRPRGA